MAELIAEAFVALWEEFGVAEFFNAAGWFTANAGLVNTALFIGATYAHNADQRRRLRNQARDAFNASLQGRQVMVRSAISPRGKTYGRDKLGGQLADVFVTGSNKEFLHLVVAYQGHQMDACETIYLNNTALPAPDGSGFIQSGVFAKNLTTQYTENTALNAGSLVLAHTPTRIVSVTQSDGGGGEGGGYTVTQLALTTGYTVAGSTVTFVPGASAQRFYTVNYENDSTVPKVRVKVHLGAAGQTADSDLVAESAGRWTSNDVGAGIAYIYYRLEFDVDVFGQIGLPEPSAAWRGAKLLDPRSSTTAWSANWALCVRDWLRDAALGLGCSSAQVIDSEINTAANISDEEVTLHSTGTVSVTNGSPNVTGSGTSWASKCYAGLLFRVGGVNYTVLSVTDDTHLVLTANYTSSTLSGQAYELRQLRYTVNGTLGTEDSPLANLKKLLGPGAGTAVWVQGRFLVRAGAFISPSTTVSEDYLADGAVVIVPRASRRDQCNRVSGTYTDGNQLYVERQYPPQSNSTYKAADGGLELTREVSFWGVTDSYRAQRLAKIELEKSRQAMTVRMNCNLKAYDYAPSDPKAITLSRYGWSSKAFEVRSRKYTPGAGLEYTDKETASTVFQWNLGDATLYSAANATNLPNPFTAPAAIAGLACDSSSTYNQALGSSITVRGKVSWTQSTDVFVLQGGQIELGWKLDNDADWHSVPPLPGDTISTLIAPLQPARITLIRIRAVNSMGRKGPYAYLAHVVQSGGAIGGGNLLVNSSFETDTDADGRADSWDQYNSGTTGSITYSIISGMRGTKAQRITAGGLGTTTDDRLGVKQEVRVDNYAGRGIVFSAFANVADSHQASLRLFVRFFSDHGVTQVGSDIDSGDVVTTADTWQRFNVYGTVPASAQYAYVYLWMAKATGGSGVAEFNVDDVQLEIGTIVTAYAPRADEAMPGVATDPFISIGNGDTRGLHASSTTATEDACSISYTNNTRYRFTVQLELSAGDQGFVTGTPISTNFTTAEVQAIVSGAVSGNGTTSIYDFIAAAPSIGNYIGVTRTVQYDVAAGGTLSVTLRAHTVTVSTNAAWGIFAPCSIRGAAIKS